MQNMVYLPHLSQARVVRAYRFQSPQTGPHCCVLLTDCASPSPVRYAHVVIVHRGPTFASPPCFAIASEVNKNASSGSGRSHFLGVFPGQGGLMHENLGGSDDWAEIEKFEQRALAIIFERFGLAELPTVCDVPEENYRLPRPYVMETDGAPLAKPSLRKWWEFWKR